MRPLDTLCPRHDVDPAVCTHLHQTCVDRLLTPPRRTLAGDLRRLARHVLGNENVQLYLGAAAIGLTLGVVLGKWGGVL